MGELQVKVDFSGMAKIEGRTKDAARAVTAAVAKYILEDARKRAPRDTGALRRSGTITEISVKGDGAAHAVRFGGKSAPYAIIVHDAAGLTFTEGEPEFLRRAAMMNRREIMRIAREAYAKALFRP